MRDIKRSADSPGETPDNREARNDTMFQLCELFLRLVPVGFAAI
jgi:hypothetical protein